MADRWAAEGWPCRVDETARALTASTARPRPDRHRGSSTASPRGRPPRSRSSSPVARPGGASWCRQPRGDRQAGGCEASTRSYPPSRRRSRGNPQDELSYLANSRQGSSQRSGSDEDNDPAGHDRRNGDRRSKPRRPRDSRTGCHRHHLPTDPGHRPLSLSGVIAFGVVMRKVPLNMSAPPAAANRTSATHSVSAEPESDDSGAPGGRRGRG